MSSFNNLLVSIFGRSKPAMFSLLAQLGFVWLCSYQLLAQMNNVLSIQFPSPVPELLDFIKLMFLDVRNLIRLDCVKEPATPRI